MNQCDGCLKGLELRSPANRFHVDRHGKVVMTCERQRYEAADALPSGREVFETSAQSIKDHEIREAVSRLRDIAKEFHGHQQLRGRIADVVVDLAYGRLRAPLAQVMPGLDEDRINEIADAVIEEMPDGLQGFLKAWGWQQFAKALLELCKPLESGEVWEAFERGRQAGMEQERALWQLAQEGQERGEWK